MEHDAPPLVLSRTSDYLVDINKVLLAMADNELLLNSSELSGGLYEDFSSQEDTLKVGMNPHFIFSSLVVHLTCRFLGFPILCASLFPEHPTESGTCQ